MNKSFTFLTLLGAAAISAVVLTSSTGTYAQEVTSDSYSNVESQRGEKGQGHKRGGRMHDETVKTAIDANDYSLLSADAQSKISQDLFALKVAHKAKKDAYKAQLETIVQSNDFEAFKTQVEAMKAEKETMKEAMLAEKIATATPEEKADIEARIVKKAEKKAEREAARAESGVSEDERLLEKFTKITEYYTENGTLPEKGMKRGKRGGNKGIRSGNRGARSGNALQSA